MENIEIELKLTVAHVNTILKHLDMGVHAEVRQLIDFIAGQAQPQIQVAPQAAPTPAAEEAPATTDGQTVQ